MTFRPADDDSDLSRDNVWTWMFASRRPGRATIYGLAGFACLGVGLQQASGGAWSLLAVPVCAGAGAAFLWAAARGPGDPLLDAFLRGRPGAGKTSIRLMSLGVAALLFTGGVLALEAAGVLG